MNEQHEDKDSLKIELRKLRKKLLDIDKLEKISAQRSLNEEELEKVKRKDEFKRIFDELTKDVPPDLISATVPSTSPKRRNVEIPKWATKYSFYQCTELVYGHDDFVNCIVSYPNVDGSFVSTSSDTTARLRSILPEKCEEFLIFNGHTGVVTCAEVFDGHHWCSSDLLVNITHAASISYQADEPLDLLITGGLDCNVCIWHLKSGKLLHQIYTYQPITKLAVLDIDLIITGTETGKIEMWNMGEKQPLYSSIFDENGFCINFISKSSKSGYMVIGCKNDCFGVFELSPDPLVGAMIQQSFHSKDLQTSKGEKYQLSKVTAITTYEDRIYVTTLRRPTIKSITWTSDCSTSQSGLVVSRFAGCHFDNSSFVALNTWSPTSFEDPSYLFATECCSSTSQVAIHVHALPHENYALSNFYVGSLVVPFELTLACVRTAIVPLRQISPGEDEENIVSPCILISQADSLTLLRPSLAKDESVKLSQIELYPKPSVCNLTLPNDSFSDEERFTTEDEEAIVVTSSVRRIPGLKKARIESGIENDQQSDDDNPPTDEDDDDYSPELNPQSTHEDYKWGNVLKRTCIVL